MPLVQYVYSTTNTGRVPTDKGVLAAARNIEICDRLAMTGRVFATHHHALSILEGPTEVMREYFKAVENQRHIETIFLQGVREIKTREFEDYSVWLDVECPFAAQPNIHPMTEGALARAMPKAPSVRLRVMIDAFFEKGRLVS